MYSIQDVSKKTGLTAHTLRYYEKEGLIPSVERSQGGFRQYTDEDLEALGLICCLKNTGHRENVIDRMAEMQKYLDKVTWKVNFFTKKLEEYEARETREAK